MNDTPEATTTTMSFPTLHDYLAVCTDHDIAWSKALRVLGSCKGNVYAALQVHVGEYDREHPDLDDDDSSENNGEATP